MGINEDAVEDLDDTLVDHDLIQSAPVISTRDEQTTVIPWSKQIAPQPPALTETQIQHIAQSDVQFKIIEDEVEHVVELETVEQEFLAQESVCQASVKVLNEHFEGLLSNRISIEEYTKSPSQTNLKITEQYLRRTIAQEQAAVLTSFTDFTRDTVTDVLAVVDKLTEDYLSPFQTNMEATADLATGVIAGLSENKNAIVPFQNGEQIEFIDIAEADLIALDFNQLKLEPATVAQLSVYRDNIKHILQDTDIRLLITLAVDCGKVSYPADSAILARSMERPVHLLLLAKTFNSEALRAYLASFEATLADAREVLEAIEGTADTIEDYDSLRRFITQRSQDIHTAIRHTLKIAQCMNHLNLLAWNLKELFMYMDQITHPKA